MGAEKALNSAGAAVILVLGRDCFSLPVGMRGAKLNRHADACPTRGSLCLSSPLLGYASGQSDFCPGSFWRRRVAPAKTKRSPGNLDMRLLRDAHLAFWTVTAWEDEAAMRAFMMSGAHRLAMPKLLNWCSEAAVAHWTQETAQLPDMGRAYRRIVEDGRLSKVHPPPRRSSSQPDRPAA